MLAWHRDLLRLRRAHPALTDGRLDEVEVEVDEDAGHLVLRRGPVQVAVNLGDETWEISLSGIVALAAPAGLAVEGGAVKLPPDGVVIAV